MTIDFNGPGSEYGGGGSISVLSGDGTRFWATLTKAPDLRLVVYHVGADGKVLKEHRPDILGKGAGLYVQGNGTLEAQGFVGYGDNQTMRAVPIPGYVPFSGGGAGQFTAEQVKGLNYLLWFAAWLSDKVRQYGPTLGAK